MWRTRLTRCANAGVDNGRTGTAAAEGRRRYLANARLNAVGWCAAGVLTAADSLYLLCTWTSAFERFSRIWRFGFPKVLGNMDFGADRLPPPPPLKLFYRLMLADSVDPVASMLPNAVLVLDASRSRMAPSMAAGLRCIYRWVVVKS